MRVLFRCFLAALFAAAAASAAPPSVAPRSGATDGPNFLLSAVDDFNTDLGAFGVAAARAPHIDRIIGRSVRTDRWRYTEWGDGVAAEFYDHAADPGNYRNVATEPALAAERAVLKKLLARNPRAAAIPADAQSPRTQMKAKKQTSTP